ncbi:PadR family transcriptional regulator [Paenibacillus sp. F6_3S_P_1C]|uniref:PadR family transcriptional regulator n=1 Tax=Paenibacillus vandeheii TaxID=3035917 RepID=A0ABT8JA34_9BACL|nr:PadR family transcriptional regulator [Paenibacillus vandeheii]MDN4601974.1 PadR family transcriptional regulator [Paenibacillus vandeheii]
MSIQIFILGTLSEEQCHPYDIKKRILKHLDQTDAKVTEGTIYYNFEVLLKKGLIEKIEIIQTDNRPDKTTYGITEKGRDALQEGIYAAFQKFTNVQSLYAALVNLDKVDLHKIAYLIEDILRKLEKRIAYIERDRPEIEEFEVDLKDTLFLMKDHAYHSIQNDITWLKKLLHHVQSRALKK